jgi:hypothetical protein
MEHPIIVCYTGGTCGDLITTLIDSTDSQLSDNKLLIDVDRERLKKPHLFQSISEKDRYIIAMQKYASIPSHDLEYHLARNHKFIGIRVQDPDTALWAATRFKELHRPHVWAEMTQACGASTVEEYAQMLIDFGNYISDNTEYIIHLEDIIKGRVLDKLEQIIGRSLDQQAKNIYNKWLENTKNAS